MASRSMSFSIYVLIAALFQVSCGEYINAAGRALQTAKLTNRAKLCGVTAAAPGSNVLQFRTSRPTPIQLINIAGNVCYKQIGAGYTNIVPGACPVPKPGTVLAPSPDSWVIPQKIAKLPGWYSLRVYGKAKCWDVIKGQLALFECTNNTRQAWQPRLSPDGYIQLVYRATNGCLQRYQNPARFWPAPCSKAAKFWTQAVDVLRCRL